MREIKFRGKRKDKWVYGFLTSAHFEIGTIDGKALNIHRYAIDSYEEQKEPHISGDTAYVVPTRYCVDKETIGQYTGLKDKNGVEIYEGDILFGFKKEVVAFFDGAFCKKDEKETVWHRMDGRDMGGYEVIGNIYDNPELLEVEE